jgi:hypothetical protein
MTAGEHQSPSPTSQAEITTIIRRILFGSKQGPPQQTVLIGVALGLFGVTFLAYELDIFYHSGGVVFVPFHAAVVGLIAACWTGYRQIGVVTGWGLTYVGFLGWRAEWATDISPRPLIERIGYVVQLDGLIALAIIGAGVAVTGFTAGAIARQVINRLRTDP